VKNKHAFGLLQVTNAVSGISNGVVLITVPWIVLELTGSAAKAGLLAALSSLPGIVVSPVVGGLIDRFGRRAISMFSDVMSMVVCVDVFGCERCWRPDVYVDPGDCRAWGVF
jgi:MFS family permease